jgi:hypothetical protein
VSGLPANIVVGCVIWAVAWIFITHLFFVSDFTASCPREVKIIFWASVTCLVMLFLRHPVQKEYAKEHMPVLPSLPQAVPAPSPPPSRRAPIPVRSYVVFDGPPYFSIDDDKGQPLPDRNLQVEAAFGFNFDFKQAGPNPVELSQTCQHVYVESPSPNVERDLIADFEARIKKRPATAKETVTFELGHSGWLTAFASSKTNENKIRVVTQEELDALHAGTEIAFVIVQINYKDKNVMHHARLCMYLQPLVRWV